MITEKELKDKNILNNQYIVLKKIIIEILLLLMIWNIKLT